MWCAKSFFILFHTCILQFSQKSNKTIFCSLLFEHFVINHITKLLRSESFFALDGLSSLLDSKKHYDYRPSAGTVPFIPAMAHKFIRRRAKSSFYKTRKPDGSRRWWARESFYYRLEPTILNRIYLLETNNNKKLISPEIVWRSREFGIRAAPNRKVETLMSINHLRWNTAEITANSVMTMITVHHYTPSSYYLMLCPYHDGLNVILLYGV